MIAATVGIDRSAARIKEHRERGADNKRRAREQGETKAEAFEITFHYGF